MSTPVTQATDLTWHFEYDDQGRVTRRIDAAGAATVHVYSDDLAGHCRKIATLAPGAAEVVRQFDEHGRLTRMVDGQGAVDYDYDHRNRLVAARREGAPAITWVYNNRNQATEMAVGEGYRAAWRYDFLGRLTTMETPAGVIRYEYQSGQGAVIRYLPNGLRTQWTREPNGRLTQLQHGRITSQRGTRYQIEVLAQFDYHYGPDGKIVAIDELLNGSRHTRRFGYDQAGRLAQGDGYQYTWTATSNRQTSHGATARRCEYDGLGRLLSVDGQACRHDLAGNLTITPARECRFGGNGALTEVVGRTRYRYDGDGHLVWRQSAAAETFYLTDPTAGHWKPLVCAEVGGAATMLFWEGDVPLLVLRGKRAEYLLTDHLGTPRLVADASGAVVRSMACGPFGEPAGEATEGLSPGFCGLFHDGDAGLYLTRARAYDPALGRFLQVESQPMVPNAAPQTHSLWTWCGGDPVNLTDRDGRSPRSAGVDIGWLVGAYCQAFQTVYDVNTAKQMYATWAQQARAGAGGLGIAANATAALFDTIGGFAPGQPASVGQAVAQAAWTITPIAVLRAPAAVLGVLEGINAARSFGSALINAGHGHVAEAALDVLSLQGSLLSERIAAVAAGQVQQLVHGGQHLWSFGPSAMVQGAVANMRSALHTIQGVDAGRAALEFGTALHEFGAANVGGVYLGGSADALPGLRDLQGVALGANGQLVLVGGGEPHNDLPPLRLDDVVTVFRSVYLYGEGPLVSIDPQRDHDRGAPMVIRHGRGTAGTMVGWLLYQADRLMKTFNLGVDNITGQALRSAVPGFERMLDTVFAGSGAGRGGNWERFWIVPAAARRIAPDGGALTLYEVPLKVMTEPMKWVRGDLVSDPRRPTSPGAAAFSEWFTGAWSAIAAEQYLMPPEGSGLTEPVPVFAETQRIALITAMAEHLCAKGVPLPAWMRDYPVRQVSFEGTTPALVAARPGGRVNIHGGADLSAADKAVQTIRTATLDRTAADQFRRAVALDRAVPEATATLGPFEVCSLPEHNAALAVLPGADTRAFLPNSRQEADLTVPVGGAGGGLALVRRYNSFHAPSGEFGNGWTLDLPRLTEQLAATAKDNYSASRAATYALLAPLGGPSTRFARVAPVPDLGGSRLLVPDQADGLFLAMATSDGGAAPGAVHAVIGKDGTRWHYNANGDLVAVERAGERTLYERDRGGRLARLALLRGAHRLASIDLAYDEHGRICRATGRDATGQLVSEARYSYNLAGQLERVSTSGGEQVYGYNGPLLTTVGAAGRGSERFEYNRKGQLLARTSAEGARTTYEVTRDRQGSRVADSNGAWVRYDRDMQPVEAGSADGQVTQWRHTRDGGIEREDRWPSGEVGTMVQTADGCQGVLQVPGQPELTARFDTCGRPVELAEAGERVARWEWSPSGPLQAVSDGQATATLEHGADGLLRRVLLHNASGLDRGQPFHETAYDEFDRPVAERDNSGLDRCYSYGQQGELRAVAEQRGGQVAQVAIERDASGRPTSVRSPWGAQQAAYGPDGQVRRLVTEAGGARAVTDFADGQVVSHTGFDGSRVRVDYADGRPAHLTAAGLALTYTYDPAGDLAAVDCDGAYRLDLVTNEEGLLASLGYRAGSLG